MNELKESEQFFFEQLNKMFDEIERSINVLRKEKLTKSAVCIAFIGADSFSRIYKIFKGAALKEVDNHNEQRFRDWLEECLLTDRNKSYTEHKEDLPCDSGDLWQLRNSLLHFYGLPNKAKTNNHNVILFSGKVDSSTSYRKGFKEMGHNVMPLNDQFLINAILRGLVVQLEYMKELFEDDPQLYIKRMKIAKEVIWLEGGVTVSLK